MTAWLIGLAAWVVASYPLGVLIGHGLRDWSAPCTCRKHAWDPCCPVHGKASTFYEDSAA